MKMSEKKATRKLEILLKNTVYDESVLELLAIPDRENFSKMKKSVQESILCRIEQKGGVIAPYSPTSKINIFHLCLLEKLKEVMKARIQASAFLRDASLTEISPEIRGYVIEPHLTLLNKMGIKVIRESECLDAMSDRSRKAYTEVSSRYSFIFSSRRQRLDSALLSLIWSSLSEAITLIVGSIERPIFDPMSNILTREVKIEVPCLYLPTIPINDINNLIFLNDEKDDLKAKLNDELSSGWEGQRYVEMLYRFFLYREDVNKYLGKKKLLSTTVSIKDTVDIVSTELDSKLDTIRKTLLEPT